MATGEQDSFGKEFAKGVGYVALGLLALKGIGLILAA
jgi:hypothetical protein